MTITPKPARCLYCYTALPLDALSEYHTSCAKAIFGINEVPVLNLDAEHLEQMANQLLANKTAVTGVQPKLSINLERYKGKAPRFTVVGMHGNYIVKPQSSDYRQLPENEDVTMHLASLANIKVANHALIRLQSGELAYITQRFDRRGELKFAAEDLCQLTETLTEHKYRSSAEKVAKTVQRFTTNKGLESQKLFSIFLFCFLTGNADMHLKNYMLLEDNTAGFTLSPAYDLLNTTIVNTEDREETALTINGKKNKILKKDFDYLGQNMGLTTKALAKVYASFKNMLSIWLDYIDSSFLSQDMKLAYKAILKARFMIMFPNSGN